MKPRSQPRCGDPSFLLPRDSDDESWPGKSAGDFSSWIDAARNAAMDRTAKSAAARGSYSRSISRADPAFILFLLDRSGSMNADFGLHGTKAEFLAASVDAALAELAVRCTKAEGTRDYFYVACLGYGDGGVRGALPSPLESLDYAPISQLAAHPRSLEPGPFGADTPRWIEPMGSGDTPMKAAFEEALRLASRWCAEHPRSYPPTVINVSDGEPTDGDPRRASEALRRLRTDDGECLVFNLHVSCAGGPELVFPSSPAGLDTQGRRLFSMSSLFPPHLFERARAAGFDIGPQSRFFAYGAGAELATRFFELGTRPSRLL